ncbi:ImmA/IrrE family metallo-endopeptidase [Streptomyces sp. NPDC091280]|uniref:ImmA/IrrE family metallo-endopeptidase n=1 Tax=Streptomyces sp. NPDC091280 TaxID=3365984 RepID=UPI0038028EEB
MTKLPDNPVLLKHYRDGMSDKEIAEVYGVSFQAVNKRLKELGIWRAPFKVQAQEILEHVWPASETNRTEYMAINRARDFFYFLRRGLGEKTTTRTLVRGSERFDRLIRESGCVLDLRPGEAEGPWVLIPRLESDGNCVIRWPEGRAPFEDEKYRAALELPETPWG